MESRWEVPDPCLPNSLAVHHADEDVRVRVREMAKRIWTDETVGVEHSRELEVEG